MVNVYKKFTANTTFTLPSDTTNVTIAVTGAGGGGGGATQYHVFHAGAGGGGGGYHKGTYSIDKNSRKLTITVGTAGEGGKSRGESGLRGNDGGPSSVKGGNMFNIHCYGGGKGNAYSDFDPGKYEAGGIGGKCSTTVGLGVKVSNVKTINGGNGKPGGSWDCLNYWKVPDYNRIATGGTSAHGSASRTSALLTEITTIPGAGGWGGSWAYNHPKGARGQTGGPGLVELWYKTNIKNIQFN